MSLQVLDDKENYSFKENDDKRVIEAKDGYVKNKNRNSAIRSIKAVCSVEICCF